MSTEDGGERKTMEVLRLMIPRTSIGPRPVVDRTWSFRHFKSSQPDQRLPFTKMSTPTSRYAFTTHISHAERTWPKIACLLNIHIFPVNREFTSQLTCSIVTKTRAYILYLWPFLFIFSLWYSFASRPSSPWISAISLFCFFS
jgi:hypothetical protein